MSLVRSTKSRLPSHSIRWPMANGGGTSSPRTHETILKPGLLAGLFFWYSVSPVPTQSGISHGSVHLDADRFRPKCLACLPCVIDLKRVGHRKRGLQGSANRTLAALRCDCETGSLIVQLPILCYPSDVDAPNCRRICRELPWTDPEA